jgi:Ca2+-binding RTX toxin-like protein
MSRPSVYIESLEPRRLLAAITSGQTVALDIDSGDIDTLTFSASANNWIIVQAATTAGALDPVVDLYDINGGPLASGSTNQAGGVDISLRAPASGTYTITVRDNGGGDTGVCNVSLLVIPASHGADPAGDGGTIISGQTRTGAIEARTDMDVLTIDAAVGDVITLAVATTSGNLDPQVTLFGPTGFADSPMSDTGGEMDGADVQYAVPLAGTYTIVVRDHDGDDTGTYNLTLTQIPGDPPAVAVYDHVLYAFGTAGRDVIEISDDAADLLVNVNGKVKRVSADGITRINVDAGDGDDIVSLFGTHLPGYVFGGYGEDRIAGGSGNDTLTGGANRDRIDGNVGADRINGSGGNDVLQGGLNNDRLYGGEGNDVLSGLSHVDRLFGGNGNDTLIGGTSNDKLYGEGGDDLLVGNSGIDIINGGADEDSAKEDAQDHYAEIELMLR